MKLYFAFKHFKTFSLRPNILTSVTSKTNTLIDGLLFILRVTTIDYINMRAMGRALQHVPHFFPRRVVNTLFLRYPHRKKSDGVKFGEQGGHSTYIILCVVILRQRGDM